MATSQIKPIIVGRLIFRTPDGKTHTPRKIFFGVGYYGDYLADTLEGGRNRVKGLAWARHFDNLRGSCLEEVRKIVTSSDGKEHEEPLIYEGFAGLSCRYNADKGTIESFAD